MTNRDDGKTEDAGTADWLLQLQAAGATDEATAREGLFRHAAARLERLARVMLRDFPRLRGWEETGDVLQNALLRLHQALGDVRPKNSRQFYGLAALQIRRELIDLSRHHFGPLGAAARQNIGGDLATAHGADLADLAVDSDARPAMLAAWQEFHEEVGRLPDKEREVVHLLWYEGLKQTEAAEILSVTERTIKNRWRRARGLLQARLHGADWLDAPPDSVGSHGPLGREDASALPLVFAGRYRRDALIAQGGFSQVWRATDLALDAKVAIKITTKQDCTAEARRVARLQHHGIVAVRDSGHERDYCFIVFDLVEGSDLEERLRNGAIPWREAAAIAAEAAERLDYAHRHGFVHRDVKPANILIGADGRVVLADFGIAVTQEELLHETLTTAGTLAYMAPEQLTTPVKVDARTDVYGLGVVLYESLTGRRPFQAASLGDLRRQILANAPRSTAELNPAVPQELDRICRRCLAKSPTERFATAGELATALRLVLKS
ncbi:MAG TPA: sigma-70 family RNA polymerase sigma factor [Pirellulales bacterium]|nr:sigma-70 family RNA polymerase sigma factor [Pirellulales bacterium]